VSELNLETVMKDVFPAIAGQETGMEEYKANRTMLRWLDTKGRFTPAHVREYVGDFSVMQKRLPSIVQRALGQKLTLNGNEIKIYHRAFLPGVSVMVADSHGNVLAAHDRPNDNEQLAAYGNGLMWAAFKLGDEAYAYGKGYTGATTEGGYAEVSKVLLDKEFQELPFKDRHHLGGATRDNRFTERGLRKDGQLVYAGVSGVLLEPFALGMIQASDRELRNIATHARRENAHEGFEGNIFAGSIDSAVAGQILDELVHDSPLSAIELAQIKDQFAVGINPH
jgi:hypothetical protein